jgi:hypothetical protein
MCLFCCGFLSCFLLLNEMKCSSPVFLKKEIGIEQIEHDINRTKYHRQSDGLSGRGEWAAVVVVLGQGRGAKAWGARARVVEHRGPAAVTAGQQEKKARTSW